MKKPIREVFVTGTGTEVGKTLVSAGLCLHLKADYWKPVQTGRPADADYIRKLAPEIRIHKTAFHFQAPLSPNQSAELENKTIDLNRIQTPESRNPVVVEGCGGVFVPLNKTHSQLDLIKQLALPVIVTALSGLGTLNHTLLTLESLRSRRIPVLGLILSGPPHPENARDLKRWGKVPVLLELDILSPVNRKNLKEAFKKLKLPPKAAPFRSVTRLI